MIALAAPLAAVATAVLVGASMVATRYAIDQTSPASLALLRYVIGFLCLLVPFWLSRSATIRGRDLLVVALLGIGQFGILIALLNYGLQHINAARGALIFATLPLMTLLLAAAIGQERLTLAKFTGVVLTIIGLTLALGENVQFMSGSASWLGDLAVLGSTLCGAVCGVLYRPYLKRYAPLNVGAIAMLASVLFLTPGAALEGFFAEWPQFTAEAWIAIGFIGVGSGAGYFLWLWALQHTTATKVTVFMGLSPLTAAALGYVLLDERLTPQFILGLGIVFGGLVVAHLPSKREDDPRPNRVKTIRPQNGKV